MNIHLIIFADGTDNIKDAGTRLKHQAENINWFNSVTLWNSNLINKVDPSWYSKHDKFISDNKRGFGYWIWKSKIIELSLLSSKIGDIVLYLDAGFELNPLGLNRFKDYLDITNRLDFLSFYLNGNNYSIRQWTKKSLLNEFNMNYDSAFINQPQIEAGCIFIKSSADSLFFIKQWQHYSTTNNYLYSNDIISNFEDDLFIEHRHDQSIMTLLLNRMSNFGVTIRNENYFPECWMNNFHPADLPLAALRNLSGANKINSSLSLK